jgi:DNA-binding SARP family transcriptional activator
LITDRTLLSSAPGTLLSSDKPGGLDVDPPPNARVALLDGFALELGDDPHRGSDVLPRGVQRLVAHLSLTRCPARTTIAGQLWPDVPEAHAHGSLRSALWRVQKIAPGLIQVCGDALALAEGVRVDVRELAAWAERVSDPRMSIEEICVTDVRLRGDLLPGWYDDWVLLDRERLRQLRMHALEALADRLAGAGRHGEAVQAAYAAVRIEPLRESAHRALVRVHLAEGNLVEALRVYDAFRAMLVEELGVAPTRQMSDLVCRIPRQRHAEDAAARSRRMGAVTAR